MLSMNMFWFAQDIVHRLQTNTHRTFERDVHRELTITIHTNTHIVLVDHDVIFTLIKLLYTYNMNPVNAIRADKYG